MSEKGIFMTESKPKLEELSGKLEVTIPEEVHTAGSESVVRVVIHNPFPVDVEIIGILAPQSSLVRRVGGREKQQDQASRKEGALLGSSFTRPAETIGSLVTSLAISSVSIGGLGVSAGFAERSRDFKLDAEAGSETKIERDLSEFDKVTIIAAENAKVTISDPQKDGVDHVEDVQKIQPHCDKVAYFSIMSNGWLFFTPQRINLSTEIRYRIRGEERTQVVTSYFDIKPPLASMIVGSLIGGTLGSTARALSNGSSIEIQSAVVSVGASLTMSLIAAIALSRKSGTQGFITVEDFFGAFVIGSLIGYGGAEYFDQAILPVDG